MRTQRALHFVLGLLVCVLVPGWSWLDGSGSLAWSMYAHSSHFRLRITATDDAGRSRSISPSALAAQSEQDLRTALGGAENLRHARYGRLLRLRLDAIAELACRVSGGARVSLTLEERATLDAPLRATRAARDCGAPPP